MKEKKIDTLIDDKRDTLEQTALPFENVYGFVKDQKNRNRKNKNKKQKKK